MDEHPNVTLVRQALEYVAHKDTDGLVSIWRPDMTYFAVEQTGPPAEIRGREEFVQMIQTGSRMIPDRHYEVVDIQAAGSDLVMAHLRVEATAGRTGEKVSGDYLGVFRIRDGLLSEGWEFTSHETQQFLDDAWG